MGIIKREDGTDLVFNLYREIINWETVYKTKKSIRERAGLYGYYTQLTSIGDGVIKAVFSKNKGVLFGESVWAHFGKGKNLIYCEEVSDRHTLLVVIVKNGVIFVDGYLSYGELIDEVAVISDNEKYSVFLKGDVPLFTAREKLPFVEKITKLDRSVVDDLTADEMEVLQPVEDSLRDIFAEQQQKRKKIIEISSIAAILVLMVSFWVKSCQTAVPDENIKVVAAPEQIDAYKNYKEALTSIPLYNQLNETIENYFLLKSVPMISVKSLQLVDGAYTVEAKGQQGLSIINLLQWTTENNIRLSWNGADVTFSVDSNLTDKRAPTWEIYPIDSLKAALYDKLVGLFNENVRVNFTDYYSQTGEKVKTLPMTVNVSSVDIGSLLLLGKIVDNFPVKVEKIRLEPVDNELFSCDISLDLLGD